MVKRPCSLPLLANFLMMPGLWMMTGLLMMTACSGVTHHHVEDFPLVTRMTLIPEGNDTLVKINGVESRTLVTNDSLTQPLQLLLIDPSLNDFQLITPQPSNIKGVYHITMPAGSPGYRVWADIRPNEALSKKQREEFPSADLGAHKIGTITKTPSLETSINNMHFALSFDHTPTADEESVVTLRATNGEGKAVQVSGDVYGFYDDFHSVLHASLDKEAHFTLIPKKPAFIKLFAVVKLDGKTVAVPFGVVAGGVVAKKAAAK